jgi:cytochrome P450
MKPKWLKDRAYYKVFGFPTCSLALIDPMEHRQRREILNPFFSKRVIASLEDALYQHVEKLCFRVQEAASSKKYISIQDAYYCTTVIILLPKIHVGIELLMKE